jgi:aminotransferase
VLCNPSNPTGRVFTNEELQTIASLAQEFDAFVITDEVYEHIVYTPYRHTYIASLPGMFSRTLSCSSLSKTYAVTGWRLGYVIAPSEISAGVRKVHDFLTVGAPAPLQEAAVTALNFPEAYYRQLQAGYTQRREIFLASLEQTGLEYTTPQGAYYVLVDISPFDFADDTQFCRWLAQEVGVAAVPGSSFFNEPGNNLIRFNFAKRIETLEEVGRRLSRLQDLQGPGKRAS